MYMYMYVCMYMYMYVCMYMYMYVCLWLYLYHLFASLSPVPHLACLPNACVCVCVCVCVRVCVCVCVRACVVRVKKTDRKVPVYHEQEAIKRQ